MWVWNNRIPIWEHAIDDSWTGGDKINSSTLNVYCFAENESGLLTDMPVFKMLKYIRN